ncbi:Hypothetical predicted protein [Scomber scombrus]|uniref:Uncharacterized protein n=1 Tax=Scomber scombrus TaxID=13677 RepID=A0AAV1PBN5_SCOSC
MSSIWDWPRFELHRRKRKIGFIFATLDVTSPVGRGKSLTESGKSDFFYHEHCVLCRQLKQAHHHVSTELVKVTTTKSARLYTHQSTVLLSA